MALTNISKQNIVLFRGQSLNISIPVVDSAGDPVDLSTATTSFGIAESEYSAYTITIATSESGNVISAPILPADSSQLTMSRYYYSAWVDIGTGKTLVAYGSIIVQSDSRSF